MEIIGSPFLLALVSAYTYYVFGVHEKHQGGNNHGLLWAAISLLVSLSVLNLFHGGWAWLLVSQIALFFGIAIVRASHQA